MKALGRVAGQMGKLFYVKDAIFRLGIDYQYPGCSTQVLSSETADAPVSQLLTLFGLISTSHVVESQRQVDMSQTSQMLLTGEFLNIPPLFEFPVKLVLHLSPLAVKIHYQEGIIYGQGSDQDYLLLLGHLPPFPASYHHRIQSGLGSPPLSLILGRLIGLVSSEPLHSHGTDLRVLLD
jgi:hypothetical protein